MAGNLSQRFVSLDDPIHQVVLAILKISQGVEEEARHRLETWVFATGANQWTKMNPPREPDASGNRARNLTFAPELNAAFLENRPYPPSGPVEQQICTYYYAEEPAARVSTPQKPHERPRIVEDAVVSVLSLKQAEITWPALPTKRSFIRSSVKRLIKHGRPLGVWNRFTRPLFAAAVDLGGGHFSPLSRLFQKG